ncbi:MAG: hypothetical protein IJ375_05510 [Oscillospiraceae bacterium]|nr:hypothetical protein [Oscillospiraceae bacterium]
MSYFYNIGSLVLGLLAWALPVAALAGRKRPGLFCGGSFGLCCLSLLFQLLELRRRCAIGDLAAVEDTIGGIVFGAEVLLIIAAALNALALVIHGKRVWRM